jgi:peptidoglycan-associated lipoprotein
MLRTLIALGLVVSALVFPGCRSRGAKPGDGDLGINTTVIGDEIPLTETDWSGLSPVTDVSFETVKFAYDSFRIAPSEIGKIEKVASYMRADGSVRLIAQGHCDERGSKEYNLSLGENRALAVRAYLVELGVPSENIQTKSFGEEQPVDPGHSEGAWSQNRRVEFALFR